MIVKKDPFLPTYLLFLIPVSLLYFKGNHGDTVLWANQMHGPVQDFLFKWITYLGDGIFFAIMVIILLVKNKRTGLVLLSMGLTLSLVSYILKRVVFKGQPRPKIYFESFDEIQLHFVEGVKMHSYNSFPSGHTLTAFALATFMVCYLKNPKMSLILLGIASLAGFSRIYLAQHFLIDVCAGSLIGVLIGYAFSKWITPIQMHQGPS